MPRTTLQPTNVNLRQKVKELLDGVPDETIRAMSVACLREWRIATGKADAHFTMHGDLGRRLVVHLARLKGVALTGDPSTGEANSLKEVFLPADGTRPGALTEPWMTSVMEFVWWFVREGFGVVTSAAHGYPISIRLTRAGEALLDSEEPVVNGMATSNSSRDSSSRLTMLEKIDIGAFADVWKAEDRFGRVVAVKIVRPSMATEVDALQHARALARAAHPNVVTLFTMERIVAPDSGAECDAIVMEFLEGETLEERLGRAFTRAEVGTFAGNLLDGLDHIHNQGLAHGDLHEANIMVTAHGVKIIDILYRDTLAILGTSSRQQRLRLDLRRAADHIRSMVERSDRGPERAQTFVSELGGPIVASDQLRKALDRALLVDRPGKREADDQRPEAATANTATRIMEFLERTNPALSAAVRSGTSSLRFLVSSTRLIQLNEIAAAQDFHQFATVSSTGETIWNGSKGDHIDVAGGPMEGRMLVLTPRFFVAVGQGD